MGAALLGSPLLGRPAEAADPAPDRLIPVRVTGSGHLLVTGAVDGHPARFILDTGCPVTIIESSAYGRLTSGTGDDRRTGRTFYAGSLGYRPAAAGSVRDIRLGDSDLGSATVGVTALSTVLGRGISGRGPLDADGILGSDILTRRHAILDLRRGTLLLDPTAADRAELAGHAAREGYSRIAMSPTDGYHFAVPATSLSGTFRLVVDSGSPATVLQRDLLSSSELSRPMRVSYMRTLGGSTTVSWMPLQNWKVGDVAVDRAVVATGNFRGGLYAEHTTRGGGRVAGVLGLELLAHLRAQIDFGTQQVYLLHRDDCPRIVALRSPALANRINPGTFNPSAFQGTGKGKGR